MKIGIFGGSFNPIHLGHLVLAEQVRDALGLHQVVFVPARIPPHKAGLELASPEHRLEMVRIATYENPRFAVSDLELGREGPSYTVETIREFQARRPGDQLFFIVGGDSVPELPMWREIESLGELCTVAAGARPGFALEEIDALEGRLPGPMIQALRENFVQTPSIDISSRDIRTRAGEGRSIRHLVPNRVLDYIRTNSLYG